MASPSATLIDALVDNNAVHPKDLAGGTIPPKGSIRLLKPFYNDGSYESFVGDQDSFHTIDASYLWQLSNRLQEEGMRDYEYVGSGADAIVFNAENTHYDENRKAGGSLLRSSHPHLRIHLGPPSAGRQCPDVTRALNTISIDNAITCEEVEYINVLPPGIVDLKLSLGLGISCLANGWSFEDSGGGNNISKRVGNTHMTILEPQAVTRLNDTKPETLEIFTNRFLNYVGNQRFQKDYVHKGPAARARALEREYSQGDVVETPSNVVVILNGNYYESNYSGTTKKHPCLEERRKLVEGILADEGCSDYQTFQHDFIVIPKPVTHTPDFKKTNKYSNLADILRKALDSHEQTRLAASGTGQAPETLGDYTNSLNSAPSVGSSYRE